jgi:hypothetical protein
MGSIVAPDYDRGTTEFPGNANPRAHARDHDGMAKQRLLSLGLPRDARATTYLVSFVVACVATILITRGILALSGYPQLGGDGLHIAHVLWGGLLMALAIMFLLSFFGPVVRPYAVIVGGIGFGLFLDEVGKFVTSTTDYFFRPALAIIYAIVVLLILGIQWVHGRKAITRQEYLALAAAEASSGVGGISAVRRRRGLAAAAAARGLPGARQITEALRELPPGRRQLGDPLVVISDRFRRAGAKVVHRPLLRRLTVAVLIITSVFTLLVALMLMVELIAREFVVGIELERSGGLIGDVGQAVCSIASAICVALGVRLLRRDEAQAYAWFERGVLINLLLTQVFAVANNQFSALPFIAVDLAFLAVLGAARGALEREEALRQIDDDLDDELRRAGHATADAGVQKAYAD